MATGKFVCEHCGKQLVAYRFFELTKRYHINPDTGEMTPDEEWDELMRLEVSCDNDDCEMGFKNLIREFVVADDGTVIDRRDTDELARHRIDSWSILYDTVNYFSTVNLDRLSERPKLLP